jgi:S1-C subfamily serine protease
LVGQTLQAGIISCVDRKGSEIGLRGAAMDFIQTDAAINQVCVADG